MNISDSAGGSAKQGRDREYQAIMPLKGVPLNTFGLTLPRLMKNAEMSDLTYALTREKGCAGSNFTIDKLKYGDINIMADADIDGKHITSLMILFIFTHLPGVIESGRLYVNLAPLYAITRNNKKTYFLDDNEYNSFIYDEIRDKFRLKSMNGKVRNITDSLINRLKVFRDKFFEVQSSSGLEPYFINHMMIIYNRNDGDLNNIFKDMKSYFKNITFKKNKKTRDININGIVDGNKYVSTTFKTIIDYTKNMVELQKELKLEDKYKYEYRNKEYEIFSSDLYEEMMDKSQPKNRQRLKGLGEMNAEDLWETTMDPKNRRRIKVTLDDVEKAEETLEMLFRSGSRYSDKRKDFIMENQGNYHDLDI